MLLHNRRLEQGAAGIGQHRVLGQELELMAKHANRHQRRGAERDVGGRRQS